MFLVGCLQAEYRYCRTNVGGQLHLQLCPAGFACMEIAKNQSVYYNYETLPQSSYYSCVLSNITYCKELCKEECIYTENDASYAENPTAYTGFDYLKGYYCPRD